MPLETEGPHLRRHLEDLHRDLEEARRLDPETRRLLEEVHQEIEHLLAEEPGSVTVEHASLLDRLERATVSAERSNPALAETVNRIAQTLANMGI